MKRLTEILAVFLVVSGIVASGTVMLYAMSSMGGGQ